MKSRRGNGKRVNRERSDKARLASFSRSKLAIAKRLAAGETAKTSKRLAQMQDNLYGPIMGQTRVEMYHGK